MTVPFSTLVTRYSTVSGAIPAPSGLLLGELAINVAPGDGTLYYLESGSNEIRRIRAEFATTAAFALNGGGGGGGAGPGIQGQLAVYNSTSSVIGTPRIGVSGTAVFAQNGNGTFVDPQGGSTFVVNSESQSADLSIAGTVQIASQSGANLRLASFRGSGSNPQAVQNNDVIGQVGARGYTPGGWSIQTNAAIQFIAAQAFTAANNGTGISFQVTPLNTNGRVEAWAIGPDSTLLANIGETNNIGQVSSRRPSNVFVRNAVVAAGVSASFFHGSGRFLTDITSSIAQTASFAVTAAYALFAENGSGSGGGGTPIAVRRDNVNVTTNLTTLNIIGPFLSASLSASVVNLTVSQSSQTVSASISASFAATASILLGSVESASFATSASAAILARSSSFAVTASFLTGLVESASFAINAVSASLAQNARSASLAQTASSVSYINGTLGDMFYWLPTTARLVAVGGTKNPGTVPVTQNDGTVAWGTPLVSGAIQVRNADTIIAPSSSVLNFVGPSVSVVQSGSSTNIILNTGSFVGRSTVNFNVGTVPALGIVQGTIPIARVFTLLRVSSSVDARLRLYSRTSYRDADLTRPANIIPSSSAGLIAEFIFSQSVKVVDTSPVILGSNMELPTNSNIAYNLESLVPSSSSPIFDFTIIVTEQ